MSRNPHKPTPETSAQVEALSGYGITHDEIALYLGIDAKTLRKHYRDVLDKGTIKANVAVARALHKNATESNNVAAQIFWMKTRGGWKETQVVEHNGSVEMMLKEAATEAREKLRLKFNESTSSTD